MGGTRGSIYHVAGPSWPNPGKTIGACEPRDPNISGLAWNPAFRLLWVATNSRRDTIWLVNPNTCDAQDSVSHPQPGYHGGGLEMDAAGNLWTISQRSKRAYLIDSGLPVFSNVSWLDVRPDEGRVDRGHARTLRIDIDARRLGAGTHEGMVAIVTNDPQVGVIDDPDPPPRHEVPAVRECRWR